MDKAYLGIEIGGTKLQLFVGNEAGDVVRQVRQDLDRSEAADGIRQRIVKVVREEFGDLRFAAAGVGFGGPLHRHTGHVVESHQVPGWAGFGLTDWCENLLRCPVFADNDANAAALAEAIDGAGKGHEMVFYVTIGSGIGGGLVRGGRIYHGTPPGESELGHLRLDRQGTTLESVASGWAVDARIRAALGTHSDSRLCQLAQQTPGAEARYLAEALDVGDSLAQQIIHETAEYLAFGLSHAVHLFHPEIVVLGGGLSLVGEPLRAAIDDLLPNFVMEAFHPTPSVRLAELAEATVPLGALLLARQRGTSHPSD
jgi:glucokinase